MSGEKASALSLVILVVFASVLCLAGPAEFESSWSKLQNFAQTKGSISGTGVAPTFSAEPRDPTPALYGVLANFTGIVRDADNDPLTVTWVWGDGTTNVTTTGPAGVNTIIRNGHIYTPPIEQGRGDYVYNITMTLYLDDGNGNNVSCTTLVQVLMPPNGYPARPSLRLNGTTEGTPVDPSAVVYVVANTSDPEGESLTWTCVFCNDADEVYRVVVVCTPATEPDENVWINVSHSFGTEGTHQIDVYASDALEEQYQVYPHNRTNTLFASVVVNSPPLVTLTINVDPATPVINVTLGYELVDFMIDVCDVDGDALTATWDFGDGTPVVVNTSAGGFGTHTFLQTRNYTEPGVFNVTVDVTDGRPGHNVTRYRVVEVLSTNRPPVLRQILLECSEHGPFVGEEMSFTVILTDPERDSIELTWDFCDGSQIVRVNLTDYEDWNVTTSVTHTYLSPGYHALRVNYTDNEVGILDHEKEFLTTFYVTVDSELPEADAGMDRVVIPGDTVWFDGTGSSDNWEIVNYTWTLTHNETEEVLWGPTPSFQFWTLGAYEVVLTVTDKAGNTNNSTVQILVVDEIPELGSMVSITVVAILAFVLLVSARRGRRG